MFNQKEIFVNYGTDITVFDAKSIKRKQLPGLSRKEFVEMKQMPFVIGGDGQIFINRNLPIWEEYLKFFAVMHEETTTALESALMQARKRFPDIRTASDVCEYTTLEDLQGIGFLLLIPIELERRKRKNHTK